MIAVIPRYDAAASIPMKYGLVYMAVVFAFSGLGRPPGCRLCSNYIFIAVFMTNPFNHANIGETYEKKWKGQ